MEEMMAHNFFVVSNVIQSIKKLFLTSNILQRGHNIVWDIFSHLLKRQKQKFISIQYMKSSLVINLNQKFAIFQF